MKFYSVLKISISSIAFILLVSLNSLGQVKGGTHQKLTDLYVMERYEDCMVKADKMTTQDKYKSEAEPYLWVSMCLIKVSQDPELEEYYPEDKSIKDAIKYAAKFKKKDDKLKSKDKDYLFDENIDFMYDLIEMGIIEGKGFLAMDNYSKASYFYKLVSKLDPENQEVALMNGTVYLLNRNRDGQEIVDNAMDYFKSRAASGGYEPNPKSERAFVDGFLYYSKYLESKGLNSDAFDVIALAIKLDPENQKFVQRYKQLSGE